MKSKAVFLDRDGVINEDTGYPNKLSDLKLIDKSAEAIKLLNDNGYLVFIITNQSGIGRGYYTIQDCEQFNSELIRQIQEISGGVIDDIRICPHSPYDNCECRKPSTYFHNELINKYNVDIENSFIIGDKDTDLIPGDLLGIQPIKIGIDDSSKYLIRENLYSIVNDIILEKVVCYS